MATSYSMHRLEEVGSTQDEARRLYANDRSGTPVLLIADSQRAGRGRTGHHWVHANRALACSLVVEPAWPEPTWGRIPLVCGLAARAAIGDQFGVVADLKWPNDIVTSDGKAGGILVEATGPTVVIGCGINLWWPEPTPEAASILEEDPGPEVAVQLARGIADRVLERLAGDHDQWGLDGYRRACRTLGTHVRWDPDGRGRAVDVAPDGGLVVETDGGRTVLRSGTVRSIRTVGTDDLAQGTNLSGDQRPEREAGET